MSEVYFIDAKEAIIADGLKDDSVEVNEKVEIAKSVYDSDAMLVVSHATGHGASSFGGAIKNVAMGCVTKKTKTYQHEMTQPVLDTDLCNQCDKCREVCKHDAISEDYELILENCIGCSSCIDVCETSALKSPDDMSTNESSCSRATLPFRYEKRIDWDWASGNMRFVGFEI